MGGEGERLRVNYQGGVYAQGHAFSKEKWAEISYVYQDILLQEGACSASELSRRCSVSWGSAKKVIDAVDSGRMPSTKPQGHGRRGVGSLKGFTMEHHSFIYHLYLEHQSRPLYSYIVAFEQRFGMKLSETFISGWFHENIGSYKGTMRLTSNCSPHKDSPETIRQLNSYLFFIETVDHRRLVFVDKKPLREKDLHEPDRRDPFTGIAPALTHTKANSRNIRYNIFAAVSLKIRHPFCTRVVDDISFQHFVGICIREGVLAPWDILVADQCTFHYDGENDFLAEILWDRYRITFIPLPPYHAELNPAELVFRALLKRLHSLCCSNISEFDFLTAIRHHLWGMSPRCALSFFRECGYFI